MGKQGEYVIHFGKLQTGKYQYRYEIGDAFFAGFAYSEVQHVRLIVDLELNRQPAVLTLNFSLSGTVNVMCDRCGGHFNIPVSGKFCLFAKFGDERTELSDEMIVLNNEDTSLDVSQHIYEYIHLLVPPSRKHPEGQCDPEALKRLDALSPGKIHTKPDPRWEALKSVKIE